MTHPIMEKIKNAVRRYIPLPAGILFLLAPIAGIILLASELSVPFSDWFNRTVGAFIRGFMATLTSLPPFSVAEGLILFIPVLFVVLIVCCHHAVSRSITAGVRFLASVASVLCLMFFLFVTTTSVAYNGSPLADKLGLTRRDVSADELRTAAEYMIDRMDETLSQVQFRYGDASVMPYSLSEMNKKLLDAYAAASDKYGFIPHFPSRIKPVCLSEPMTYTHISGMYTFYTGEANLNIHFPDFNLPYTAAHELSHQRGILPENEANFMAFLVCIESEDPYIRYSAYLNIYQYLNNALYSADYDQFAAVYRKLDNRVIGELRAYSTFFNRYRDSVAADVSDKLNDTYLKAQGQTAGTKSYGMVVDLAVAYVLNEIG